MSEQSEQSEHQWAPEDLETAAAIAYVIGKDQEFVLANDCLDQNGLPNMAKLSQDLDALQKSYDEGSTELKIDTVLAKEQLQQLLEYLKTERGIDNIELAVISSEVQQEKPNQEMSDLLFRETTRLTESEHGREEATQIEQLEQSEEQRPPEDLGVAATIANFLGEVTQTEQPEQSDDQRTPEDLGVAAAIANFLGEATQTEQPEQSERQRTPEDLEVAEAIAYIIGKDQGFVLANDYLDQNGLPNMVKLSQDLDALQKSHDEGNSELQIDTVLAKEQLQQLLEYYKSARGIDGTELAALSYKVQAEKDEEEANELLFRQSNCLAALVKQGGEEATKILQRLAERLSGTTKRIGMTVSAGVDADSHSLAQAKPELRDSIPEPVRKYYEVTSASLRDSLPAPVIGGGGKSTTTTVAGG